MSKNFSANTVFVGMWIFSAKTMLIHDTHFPWRHSREWQKQPRSLECFGLRDKHTHTHARVCLLFRSPQARLRVKQRSVCSVSLMLLRGQYLHTIATPASATDGSVESRWIDAGGKSQRKMKFSRCASAAPDAAPCYCWEGSRVSRWVSKSRVWKREEKTQGKLTFIFILFATKSRKQEMGTCMSITINHCCFIELEYYEKKRWGKFRASIFPKRLIVLKKSHFTQKLKLDFLNCVKYNLEEVDRTQECWWPRAAEQPDPSRECVHVCVGGWVGAALSELSHARILRYETCLSAPLEDFTVAGGMWRTMIASRHQQ